VIACPACKSEDMCWLPPKFKSPSHADQTLRRLAERYGMSDMGQRGGTRAGEKVKQALKQAPVTETRAINYGGITFDVPMTKDGAVAAQWSASGGGQKIKNINTDAPYGGIASVAPPPAKVVARPYNGD